MSINVEIIYRCLSDAFAVDVTQDEQDALTLYLRHENCFTSITIELFAFRVVDETEPRYGAKLWGTFIGSDNEPLNLHHYSKQQLDALCHQLSDELHWCRLRPLVINDEQAVVDLYRATHLPTADDQALAQILQETINDVLCEWLVLYPIIQAVANNTLDDFEHLGALLNHSGKQQ